MSKTKSVITILLLFFTQYAIASESLITVVGKGSVSKTPDKVVITVGVSLRNTDHKKLGKEIDNKSSEIIAYLKSQGIYEKDIQTSHVNLQPYYPYDPNNYAVKPQYYTGSQSLTFTLKKIEKYDYIMEGLYDVGVNNVDNVVFKIDDEDTQRQQARKLAAKDAKDIATVLAKELGVDVGKVYSIIDQTATSYYVRTYDFSKNAAAADISGGGPSIAGGVVTIDASVQVNFYIDYKKKY